MLGIIFSGNIIHKNWNNDSIQTEFYSLKNIVMNIFKRLSIPVKEKAIDFDGFENSLGVFNNKKRIALIGSVSNKYKTILDINEDVYYASLDIDLILKNISMNFKKYKLISKFPSVIRELNFVFDKNVQYNKIEELILNNSKSKNLINMSLSDVYENKKLLDGKKSYTLSFSLIDNEKTLTEKEIQFTMNKIQHKIEKQFGATLRS